MSKAVGAVRMSVVALAGAAIVAAAPGVGHGATANASGLARSVAAGGYAWPAPTPITELVSGDLNNDKRADLALVGGPGWSAVPTAFSNGNGSFTIRHKSAPDFGSWAAHPDAKAVTTDLNGDGHGDLVLAGPAAWNGIHVGINIGNGESYYHTVASSPYFAQLASQPKAKLIAGDFNGDGKGDVALTGGDWSTIPVALSNGNGSFTFVTTTVYPFPLWASDPAAKVVAADFNNDTKTDLALTGPAHWHTVPVAFSNGDGSFAVSNYPIAGDWPLWASDPSARVVAGDFNADGRGDLALTGPGHWTTLPVAFGAGNGQFSPVNYGGVGDWPVWASDPQAQVVSGDYNNDGRTDIAMAGGGGWTTIPVAFSTGNGTFSITNYPV